jgi:hypothetical protein
LYDGNKFALPNRALGGCEGEVLLGRWTHCLKDWETYTELV